MTKNKKQRLNKPPKGNYSRRRKLRACTSWSGDNRTYQYRKEVLRCEEEIAEWYG